MRRILAAALALASAGLAASAAGSQQTDVQVRPDQIHWMPIPFAPGADAAWLIGGPTQPGLYALRVRLAANAEIPPHTHPDARMITVLSGELWVGRGARFDPGAAEGFPAGSFFVTPARAPHFAFARSETVYQESGVGPSPTNLIEK
jgi:quercetin dioxygenase-like cupin family protein